MAGSTSIWMNRMNLAHLSLEPQALTVSVLWQRGFIIIMPTSGDLLSCLPLQLTLRGTSTIQSSIYYVDLTLRDGINLKDAITSAKQMDTKQGGRVYQEALDHVAR